MLLPKLCEQCGLLFSGWPKTKYCPVCRKVKQGERNLGSITCKRCKILFLGGPNALYCPSCRTIKQSERSKGYYLDRRSGTSRSIGSTGICVACGKNYIIKSGHQRYCAECSPCQGNPTGRTRRSFQLTDTEYAKLKELLDQLRITEPNEENERRN